MSERPRYKIELWYNDNRFFHWRWSIHEHRSFRSKSWGYDAEGYTEDSIYHSARRTKSWAMRAARRRVNKYVARDLRIAQKASMEIYVGDDGDVWSDQRVAHALRPNDVTTMNPAARFTITELVDVAPAPRELAVD
jgi:hypothetical protein